MDSKILRFAKKHFLVESYRSENGKRKLLLSADEMENEDFSNLVEGQEDGCGWAKYESFQMWKTTQNLNPLANIPNCDFLEQNVKFHCVFHCSANDESSNGGWDAHQPALQYHTIR